MSWPRISRAARTAIVERLANVTTGFNPNLLAAFADAGITAPRGWKIPIDFVGSSFNFFQADITPQDLDDTTVSTYPAMTLYTKRSDNQNLEKARMYTGPVIVKINFFASWISSKALPDFETVGDCYEEALFQTFNNTSNPAVVAWAVGPSLSYNGDLSIERSKLSKDGENWFQDYMATLIVDVFASSAS